MGISGPCWHPLTHSLFLPALDSSHTTRGLMCMHVGTPSSNPVSHKRVFLGHSIGIKLWTICSVLCPQDRSREDACIGPGNGLWAIWARNSRFPGMCLGYYQGMGSELPSVTSECKVKANQSKSGYWWDHSIPWWRAGQPHKDIPMTSTVLPMYEVAPPLWMVMMNSDSWCPLSAYCVPRQSLALSTPYLV